VDGLELIRPLHPNLQLLDQQVERWLSLLMEKQVRRGSHKSTWQLEDAIRLYLATNNPAPKPFIWTKIAEDILATVARFCQ